MTRENRQEEANNLLSTLREKGHSDEEILEICRCMEQQISNRENKKPKLRKDIVAIMQDLGLSIKNQGTQYLVEGIILVIGEPDLMNCMSNGLYPEIGKLFKVSAHAVQESIRNSIRAGWTEERKEKYNQYFGTLGKRPSSGVIIATLAEQMRT